VGSQALSRDFGLDRGFDYYDDQIDTGNSAWFLGERREATEVTSHALTWLKSVQFENFFLFLHYFDAHDIDKSTTDRQERFRTPGIDSVLPGSVKQAIHRTKNVARSGLNHVEIGEQFNRYGRRFMLRKTSEIDEQIGVLLAELSRQKQLDKTLIIVTSDHGDDFMQHGERTHRKYLYDTTLRVPLIVYPKMGNHPVIGEQVSLVDILPFVLSVLGLETNGLDMSGRSFLDLLDTKQSVCSSPKNRNAYSETVFESLGSELVEVTSCYAALRSPPWKLIWDRLDDSFMLYDLENDPGERFNIVEIYPTLRRDLADKLKNLAEDAPVFSNVTDDAVIVSRLKDLGYL
jgi:hypothetical protein